MDGVILMTSSVRQDGNNLFMMGLMRKISVYILGVLLVAAVSCVNEQNFDVIPSAGDEVKFAAEMGESVATKTLYGADDPDAIMVKWVNGDKIKIFGTTCAVQEADYVVSVDGVNTPNVDDGKNIADGLTKTGEAGVQWGTADVSDFIAIYPSDKAEFKQNGTTVSVKSTIPSEQNYVFTPLDENVVNRHWEGTNFSTDRNNPTMGDAIMYAYTSANKSDSTVPLAFNPLTTVLKFRFMGYEYGSELADDETISVQSITVTAPEEYAISGDFNISFSDGAPDVKTAGNNSNSITLNTMLPDGLYLKMQRGDVVDFNVFTIPLVGNIGGDITRLENVEKKDAEGNTITDEQGKAIMVSKYTCEYPWTITIKTASHGSFKYTTIPNHSDINKLDVGEKLEVEPYALAPGKIHKIKVPQIIVDKKVVWNPENWITQVPPPVYISELSVPGAWYCFDADYQNSTDLSELYGAGIRAFNIDCRIAKESTTTGAIKTAWSDSDYPNNAYLACAGTEYAWGFSNVQYLRKGTEVKDAVVDLVELAKANPKEYIVIVFSFAEKPHTNSSGTRFGSVNPVWIMTELNEILNTSGIKEYLYTGLHSGTAIEDITNRQADGYVKNVIVKINHCTDNFYSNSIYSGILPAGLMGSFGSMSSLSTYNTASDNITDIAGLHNETKYADYFTTMRFDDIYNGDDKTDMIYCYHQAQYTTSSQARGQKGTGNPSLGMRMDAIDSLIVKSKSVYENTVHNHWFQMGIGGSLDGDDPAGVSSVLNPYLNTQIQKKMNIDPSPVGIVLMNHCTVEDDNKQVGIDLVNSIIEMNGKFYLNRRGNDVTTGGGTSAQELDTKAAAYVGPDAF